MAADVIAVADEVLRQAKKAGRALTPLQVMKLVYISLGWWSVLREGRLFNERVEAWKFGPVIPDLYQATKRYGRGPIPLHLIHDQSTLDDDTQKFLGDVVAKYGHLSGSALSSLTHKQNSPWAQTYRDGVLGLEIPYEVIQSHYTDLLNEQRRGTAAA